MLNPGGASAPAPIHRQQASVIVGRKDSHIRVCLDEDVDLAREGSPWDSLRLRHRALPEVDRQAVDTSVVFLGKRLGLPLLIGSMTGGTAEAGRINRRLAAAAQHCSVGMCLGSQRVMLEQPELTHTFAVREVAPDILLLSNLGAVQLGMGVRPSQARQLVEAVGADALVLHLNAGQEAVQHGGDTHYGGLVRILAKSIPKIGVPCGVKEVGCGFAAEDVELLGELPLHFIESSGRGGTSWTRIEGLRHAEAAGRAMGELFADWGHSSVESLRNCLRGSTLPVVASGGIRSGLDAAKALALGASLTAMALPLLRAAAQSTEAVIEQITLFREALVTAMFLTGSADVSALRRSPQTGGNGLTKPYSHGEQARTDAAASLEDALMTRGETG
jgi:isopentenyl-diphosphate delta-isomerase